MKRKFTKTERAAFRLIERFNALLPKVVWREARRKK